MTYSLEGTIAAHLDAWNAPGGPARTRAIAELYSADVIVGEPGAEYHGHSGMEQAISNLHAQAPGTVITRSGPIQTAQELVTYSWELGATGQPATATGRDVLIIRDAVITKLYVLIDAPGQ